ncbi:hypothetical protein DOY81_011823 [Sarcophaga bullata]|nr:hypothetical protein DOY81_011823 [Sarcophaga bullata]
MFILLRSAWKTVTKTHAVRVIKKFHHKAFSDKYLLLTNVTISLGLSSAGDKYCGEIEKWDPKRTSHMAVSGMTVGVICHYWYQFLDARLPGRSIQMVVKKILLDQFICSPVYISAFFVTLGILERKSKEEVLEEMKEKAWKLYAAEWMIWPVAQFVNFYWLPLKYRIFYDNMISLGYDVYTSQVKHAS